MRDIIGTILAILRGLGGGGPINQAVMSFEKIVSTYARGCYSTVAQAVSTAAYHIQGHGRGLRHMLYYCNALIHSRIGGGAPSPQVADTGRGPGPHTPSRISNFFQTYFTRQYSPNFYTVQNKLLVP